MPEANINPELGHFLLKKEENPTICDNMEQYGPKDIVLSELSRSPDDKCCLVSLTQDIQTSQMYTSNK